MVIRLHLPLPGFGVRCQEERIPTMDIEKQRKYRRDWYYRNQKHAQKEKAKRKESIRIWFRQYKETLSCTNCSENDWRCLDFHHLKDKTHLVSKMVQHSYSIENITKEIAKCIVLCANCHRKETIL